MSTDKKQDACEPGKQEKDIAEDSRILLQVDDKLIGDDKIIPGLANEENKNSDKDKDAVY
jgi:hypothetical protein